MPLMLRPSILDALLSCGGCTNFNRLKSTKEQSPSVRLASAIRNKDAVTATKVLRDLAVKESCQLGEVVMRAARRGNPNELTASTQDVGTSQTALHCAVRESRIDVIKGLILAGANVDHTHIELAKSKGIENGEEVHRIIQREVCVRKTQEFSECLSLLPKVQCFSNLQLSEFPKLATACTLRTYQAGQVVIQQGSRGHELFMIHNGTVEVIAESGAEGSPTVRREKVAVLGPGQYFGEAALQTNAPRNATVQAATRLEVFVLSRANFNELGLRYRLTSSVRKRAVIQGTNEDDSMTIIEPSTKVKTREDLDFIAGAMRSNINLSPLIKHFDDERMRLIADQAFRLDVQQDVEVVKQRDIKADLFYVVQRGTLDVIKDGEKVGELGPGTSFGELALIFRVPRAATVKSSCRAKLWALRRQDLRAIMQAPLKAKLEDFARVVQQVPLLKGSDVDLVAQSLVETTFSAGEDIIREGDIGDTLYILREGEVEIEKGGVKLRQIKATLVDEAVEVFGERALLSDEPRAATVRAVSPKVDVLALHRSTFQLVTAAGAARNPNAPHANMVQYSQDELEVLGALGNGSFGRVSLVKCKKTDQTFALKCLSKGHVVEVGAEANIFNEKRIMRMTDSPFVLRLAATFESDQELSFLMEPVLGGDLFGVYHRNSLEGSEPHARFYVACVVLALEHLHARQIIYRDLKPENLLLDHLGYLKVADFGLAKFVVGRTYTTCGTPCYFAPEMILGEGHSHAVDWWALGVLVYELMIGDTPFNAVDLAHTLRRVQRGISIAYFPDSSATWVKLVKAMCTAAPEERLPMLERGVLNITEHEWFAGAGFDWQAVRGRRMPPPFVPSVASPADLSNFEDIPDEPPSVRFDNADLGRFQDFNDPWGPRLDGR